MNFEFYYEHLLNLHYENDFGEIELMPVVLYVDYRNMRQRLGRLYLSFFVTGQYDEQIEMLRTYEGYKIVVSETTNAKDWLYILNDWQVTGDETGIVARDWMFVGTI
ncbi:hypothetical protein DH09_08105 [Bacillaceae bacterium JMAK1]|nr:hypothetical protein DH09_08105 [Bacillaceae bacterium JMAK1]